MATLTENVAKNATFYPINDHLGIKITTSRAAIKITPIYTHAFEFAMPCNVTDAKNFYMQMENPETLQTMSDKLRFYRHKNGLKQSEVAKMIGVDRGNYTNYENNSLDYYPAEMMDKLAKLYKISIYDLLDDYNKFLHDGQGRQIKDIRKKLNLTQKELAKLLDVQLVRVKRWENEKNRILKFNWEKLIKLI